jgi:hypothetical protein
MRRDKKASVLGGLSVSELSRRVFTEVSRDKSLGQAAQLAYYFLGDRIAPASDINALMDTEQGRAIEIAVSVSAVGVYTSALNLHSAVGQEHNIRGVR